MLCDVARVDYQIRQDSIRSEKVAHIRDIIGILRNLDKDNKLPLFVIDAVGLAKLPKINAEDICYVSVAEKIAQFSSKLDVLNDVVANNSVRSVKNEHDIQSMENNYSKYVTNVSSNSNSALSMKCDPDGISHMKKGPNSAPPGSTQGHIRVLIWVHHWVRCHGVQHKVRFWAYLRVQHMVRLGVQHKVRLWVHLVVQHRTVRLAV